MNKSEEKWVIKVGLILLLVTTIPYLLGYFLQGSDWRFTGFLFGVEDGNSYIAKMLTGTYGSWLFRSPYTGMSQNGTIAFLPYLMLGKLASNPEVHDQLVVLFQLFRWGSGLLLIFATYKFSSLFISELNHRRTATLVILLGGGFGWLAWLLFPALWNGRLPLEVYSPEAFGFLSFLSLPHLSAARAMLLLGLVEFLKSESSGNPVRIGVKSGLWWFAAGLFQPLTIVVGYGILGIFFVIQLAIRKNQQWRDYWPLLIQCVITAAISSPLVFYNYFFFENDLYLKEWYLQNIISSPPLLDYLWSYGLFLLITLPIISRILRNREINRSLLVAWLISSALMAYFPYNVQRRLIDGIWVALVILIVSEIPKYQSRLIQRLHKAFILATIAAPVLVMLVAFEGVLRVGIPTYRPASEVAMFQFLSYQAKPGDIVLAGYDTANALPAWAPVRVLAGHGPESAKLKTVLPIIESFYMGENTLDRQNQIITNYDVKYIIYGPIEKRLGQWNAESEQYKLLYDQNGYQVFQVGDLIGN